MFDLRTAAPEVSGTDSCLQIDPTGTQISNLK